MQTNVGAVDAWIRGALAVAFLIVAAVSTGRLAVSLIAALLALLLAATALTRSCPLYTLLRIGTKAQPSPDRRR